MSDFFGDDFTAELKSYFLNSVMQEVDKFVDLVDDSLWKRIRGEVAEQCQAWAVDAKTNEFMNLASWCESFEEKSRALEGAAELVKALKTLRAYAETLLQEGADSPDLATRFALNTVNLREVLYLHCHFGVQEFAIPLLNVIEISGKLPLYALPEKREGLLGVVPFRGEAVPVLSLHDHGFAKVESSDCYFVICEQQGVRFSLQVTQTDDLVRLKEADLQDIDNTSTMISVNFVHQFFIKDSRSIMILDLEKMVA